MANIGVQLMMVKNEIGDQGMYPVLERIAELGYRSVEVSQVATDEANIAGLERAKNELGVEVAAMSVGLKKGSTNTGDALDVDFDRVVDNCRRLDCRFTRIGMMPFDAMVSKDAVVAFAEQAEEAAQRLAAEGITLAYHNHHVDFAKYDGETLFDIVRRVSPTLHFEIDVHWVQRGGRNPVDVLRGDASLRRDLAATVLQAGDRVVLRTEMAELLHLQQRKDVQLADPPATVQSITDAGGGTTEPDGVDDA